MYLPRAELERFGLNDSAIAGARIDPAWVALMVAQTARARTLLLSGMPLLQALGGRIGLELRLTIDGGLRIAERIDAVGGDVFRHRPTLRRRDWLLLLLRALRPGRMRP
ncbi:MAG: squalene/phytoene synthase family protein [Sutterellaceae bacterium]|nr:squalene/phytoene synthase family protein [Sutterellaceae bacterium]